MNQSTRGNEARGGGGDCLAGPDDEGAPGENPLNSGEFFVGECVCLCPRGITFRRK